MFLFSWADLNKFCYIFTCIIITRFLKVTISYLLPNLSHVPCRQHAQVGDESAGVQDFIVQTLLHGFTKHDVILQGGILYPGLLGHVGYISLWGQGQYTQLPQPKVKQHSIL